MYVIYVLRIFYRKIHRHGCNGGERRSHFFARDAFLQYIFLKCNSHNHIIQCEWKFGESIDKNTGRGVAPCFFLDLALVIVVFPISFPGLHHCVTVYRSTKLERHSVELASPPKSLIPQILLLLNAEENKPSVDYVSRV